jgi:hypothetical protein
MKKAQNRRKYARFPGKGVVTYRRSVPFRGTALRELRGEGELTNLSTGGLCLVTEERLAPKQLLSLTVPMRSPALAIPTLVYVQWTKPLRGTGRYAAGVSFMV